MEFKRKHPYDFQQYAYLTSTTLSTFKMGWAWNAGSVSGVLASTEQHFSGIDGVKEFVDSMAEGEQEDRQRMLTFISDLESASSGGGAICEYEWSDGETRETGFLVLKSGDVVRREPLITDYLVHGDE